ncbi:hypothetical protein EJ110_NYTH19048 [Nymphaea thermarum]|nr:hypothetical protein EJ110_NYTH19048 [Nymphaea thermarum]
MASVAMGLFLRSSFLSPPQPTTRSSCLIASSTGPPTVSTCSMGERKKLPILLFDVMDTIVRDPFYEDVPAFFGMPMKELLEAKHPTAWGEFEEGLINESELASKFFKDGRPLDLQGLKDCMRHGYSYLSGMQMLLQNLKESGYEMHAFTNYPVWYMLIEEELKLSAYLNWTFCSCFTGKRKPDAHAYLEAIKQLGVHSSDCIFIDDRIVNVKAAANAGMAGIHFKNASALEHDLLLQGVDIKPK